MTVRYVWRGNATYYSSVVDHYYRQLPILVRLRTQAVLIWIVLTGAASVADFDVPTRFAVLGLISAFGLAYPYLAKRAIVFKYRLRPTFGEETSFELTEKEVVVKGPGAGRFPWTVYDRAIQFTDGILLARRGGIRWLPESALTNGTTGEALAIVQKHLPVRDLVGKHG